MIIQPSSAKLFASVSNITVISFVSLLLLFSLFSLFFILHFHFKTRRSHHLKDFNSLWTVRILLVTFISLWALSDLLRLPLVRRHRSFSLLPSFSAQEQETICKYHVVLSQGLFEPGFLVTLLFLVNFSIKRQTPEDTFGPAVAIVLALCVPILLLQVFFVFFASETFFTEILWSSSVAFKDGRDDIILCVYPLFSTIIFGTFASVYMVVFLLSSWKVASLVINKGLRVRIYTLIIALALALPIQIVCLVLSSFLNPHDMAYEGLALMVVLTGLLCALVGEGILVIRPIADALAVGRRDDCLPVALGEKTVVLGGR